MNLENNVGFKDKVIPHNYGWSNVSKDIEVNYSEEARGRNKTTNPNEENGLKVIVQVYDATEILLNIIKENGDRTIVLKIDCEGAEFEIFNSFCKLKLPIQVKGFILEWHFSEPTIILQYLSKNGFKLVNTTLNSKSGLIYAFR